LGTSHGKYSQTIDVGYTTTASVSNLTAGETYFFVVSAYNSVGDSLPSNEVSFTPSSATAPRNPGDSRVFLGNTRVLPLADQGYENLLVAQKTALRQSATLESMSVYVVEAAGSLKLGVYDASGEGGTPGKLVGGTGVFVPHAGWNTVEAAYQVRMGPGIYWIAYWANNNGLVLAKAKSGVSYYYRITFDWLFPKIFHLTLATRDRVNWSLYATLKASPFQATIPPPANPPPMVSYTTNFRLLENPISENGNWVNGGVEGISWTNVRTTGGMAVGTMPGNGYSYSDSTAVLTGTWGPNQTSQAVVVTGNQNVSAVEEAELRLRTTIKPRSITGYEICFRNAAPEGYVVIVRWNGPPGSFTTLASENGAYQGIRNGDVIKASMVGGTITAYINGVLVCQATDSTFTSGSPGIGFLLDGATGINANYGFSSFSATSD
jgi:hypothetical protein